MNNGDEIIIIVCLTIMGAATIVNAFNLLRWAASIRRQREEIERERRQKETT